MVDLEECLERDSVPLPSCLNDGALHSSEVQESRVNEESREGDRIKPSPGNYSINEQGADYEFS